MAACLTMLFDFRVDILILFFFRSGKTRCLQWRETLPAFELFLWAGKRLTDLERRVQISVLGWDAVCLSTSVCVHMGVALNQYYVFKTPEARGMVEFPAQKSVNVLSCALLRCSG